MRRLRQCAGLRRATGGHKVSLCPGAVLLLDFYDLRRAPSPSAGRAALAYTGGVANSMVQSLDVTQIVDRQPVSRFLLGVIFLCTLVTLADGYNISVIAFAAPGIVKAWHLNRAALGPLFSSSLVAGLVGPFLFGTAPVYSDFLLFGILENFTFRGAAPFPANLPALRAWRERLTSFRCPGSELTRNE